eukprot:RCo031465
MSRYSSPGMGPPAKTTPTLIRLPIVTAERFGSNCSTCPAKEFGKVALTSLAAEGAALTMGPLVSWKVPWKTFGRGGTRSSENDEWASPHLRSRGRDSGLIGLYCTGLSIFASFRAHTGTPQNTQRAPFQKVGGRKPKIYQKEYRRHGGNVVEQQQVNALLLLGSF